MKLNLRKIDQLIQIVLILIRWLETKPDKLIHLTTHDVNRLSVQLLGIFLSLLRNYCRRLLNEEA